MSQAAFIFEPIDRRIRIQVAGQIIAESARAMMLIERGHHPVYYLPREDFAAGALKASTHTDASATLGPARYWSVEAGGQTAPDVAFGYEATPAMAGYLTLAWGAARWFEEDEEIFRHPRNPYVRIDTVASSRHVEVVVAGQVVADTRRAIFLFETGMITRYYMPIEDVRAELLRDSDLTSYCPYKGTAHYKHVELDGVLHENIVWFYPEPYPESARVKGLLSFYNEKIEAIRVDGVAPERRFPPRLL